MEKYTDNTDLYQSIIHHLRSGVAVYKTLDDGKSFILKDANKALEIICNIDKNSILGKDVLEIFPGIYEMGLLTVIQQVYQDGQPIDHPTTLYKDQSISFWASNYVYKLETNEVVVIFDDITDIKKKEQELEKFKTLFDTSVIGHVITTLDGKLTYVNEYFAESHGYTYDDLIGHNIQILHSKEHLTQVNQILDSFKKDGTFGPVNVPHVHKNGSKLIMLMTGVIIVDDVSKKNSLALSAIDITEQESIKSEHQRLTAAIQQTADAVVITDVKGTIEYVNPAFEKLTGFSKQEAIGNNPRVLKSDTHSSSFYENMWATISSGTVWKGRICNKRKDGSLFTEDACISPVFSSDGEIQNYVAVKHDITRELELVDQLQHAVKMEAIGTLAGGIAHDFNNILTVINGYAILAQETIPEDHEAFDDLQQILLSGDRAADLVRQILLYSRKKDIDFKTIQPYTILKETYNLLKSSIASNITIEMDCEEDCHFINADAGQIQQIFMNLTANATYAMEKRGGTLSLFLANSSAVDEFNVPHIVFRISDSGIGIEKENRDKIFDPFFTTKAIGEGTGLGLAVVHGIVQSHNGRIDVESREFNGSTFTIRIPTINEIKSTQERAKHTTNQQNNNEHILIVDDETAIGHILQRILNKAGYRTTYFDSSRKALLQFSNNPTDYDLLLTDYMMPEIDGNELAMLMVKKNKNLQVIICTGHVGSLGKVDNTKKYPTTFLYKPIKQKDLLESIRKVLE